MIVSAQGVIQRRRVVLSFTATGGYRDQRTPGRDSDSD